MKSIGVKNYDKMLEIVCIFIFKYNVGLDEICIFIIIFVGEVYIWVSLDDEEY